MKLFNLIKRSIVSRKTADTGQFPVAQVDWNDKTADIEVIYPYGLSGNLPVDALVLMFNVNGQEENKAGIGNTPKDRFKNLEEGEVAVGNPLTRSVIKFLENGDIEVTGVNDQNITITGDVNLTVAGNINAVISGNTTLTTTGDTTVNTTANTVIDTTGDTTIETGGNTLIDTTGTTTIDSTGDMSSTIGGALTANVTGNTSITSPITTITGALRVTGEVTAFYNLGNEISFSDIRTTYNSHTHDENDNAPNPTDAPNQTLS